MSKTISFDYGHGMGEDRGASGYVNEEVEIRKYAKVCVDKLTNAGFKMVNCTPPTQNMTLGTSLSYRTNHANASGSILHLCFHVNAFKTTSGAMGAEIEVKSDVGARYGQSILTEICKLGFISRGIKRPSLYVTNHTDAICCLIEPFFCDSKADVSLYNPTTLGNAIANGVIKILGGTQTPTQPTDTFVVRNNKTIVKTFNDLYEAKDFANKNIGYKVYDSKNKYVYELAGAFRVRLEWNNEDSEIGCFDNLYKAKDFANLHKGYSVFNSKGEYLYKLAVAKPAPVVVDEEAPFRVVAGSFDIEEEADKQIEKLKKLGIDSFKTQK